MVKPRDRAMVGHLVQTINGWCHEAKARVETCEPADTPCGYALSDQASDAVTEKFAKLAAGYVHPVDELTLPPAVKEALVEFGIAVPAAPGTGGGDVDEHTIEHP